MMVGEPEPVCAGSGTSPPWSRRWMRAVAPIRSPAWVRRGASAIPRGSLLDMSKSFRVWRQAMQAHEEARFRLRFQGSVCVAVSAASGRRELLFDAIGEGCLDGGAGMQRPQDGERGDGGAGEFGGDVRGDGGEPQDADVEQLPDIKYRFEILAAEVSQAEVDALACHRLADDVGMPFDLVADGGAYEVGAVGVEPLLHQQVDVAEIDIAEIDGDLLAVRHLRSDLGYVAGHLISILSPSVWMVNRIGPSGLQGGIDSAPLDADGWTEMR